MASPKILISVVAVFALVVGACGPSGNLEKGVAAYESEDWDIAYHELSPLAEKGVPEAQHYIGLLYLNGNAVPKNQATALDYLRAAADQGYSESQYELGFRLIKGEELEQDVPKAEIALQTAFENGNVKGAEVLCRAFAGSEWEVTKDREKGIKWCRLAAEKGGDNEKGMLGYYLAKGGSINELEEGYRWLSVSADEGNEHAKTFLGRVAFSLAEKLNSEYRSSESLEWYEIASDHGNPDAQARIGYSLTGGYFPIQAQELDIPRGLSLLRTAAEADSDIARWCLSLVAFNDPPLIDAAEAAKWATRGGPRKSDSLLRWTPRT